MKRKKFEETELGKQISKLVASDKTGEVPVVAYVLCDLCGESWTNQPESGGFLFESKAYCPECAKTSLPRIKALGEEHFIRARCPEGMSYYHWVLKLRENWKDGNLVKITVGADAKKLLGLYEKEAAEKKITQRKARKEAYERSPQGDFGRSRKQIANWLAGYAAGLEYVNTQL